MSALPDTGVHRGFEVRCPACTRFIAPGTTCPHCLCGAIAPERYGSARTLLRAGVDRFALAGRVAALDPTLVEELERRYAAQWGVALCFVDDARRIEARHLLQRGFAEDVEDAWAALLPLDEAMLAERAGPPGPLPDALVYLWRNHPGWDVRRLAALALMHQGRAPSEVRATVEDCLEVDGRVGVEAMLALLRWRNGPSRLSKERRERLQLLARATLVQWGLAPRAAVAWTRAARGSEPLPEDVRAALRAGLHHPDADVRFDCALCLEDEEELLAALDSPDADTVSEARRALTALGSPRLFARLAQEGDEVFVKEVLGRLPDPLPPGALAAVLTVSARTPGAFADRLQSFATRRPFHTLSPEDQRQWADWALTKLPGLSGETALRFLHWAGTPPEGQPSAPRESESVRAFVAATAESLAEESPSRRASCIDDGYFTRFLLLAGPEEEALVKEWARDADCAGPLFQALLALPGRMNRLEERAFEHAARLLMAAWEGLGLEARVEPVRKAVRQWSATSGREVLLRAVWERFQTHSEERGALLAAFEPWRDALWERQVEAEPDPVARFDRWWRVDPEGLYPQVSMLMRDAPSEDLPRRLARVWTAAEETARMRPRTASLAVSVAASALSNALEEARGSTLHPELHRLQSWFPDFARRVRAAPPSDAESNYVRDFLDETEETLARMVRLEERQREDEEQERMEELRRRVEESRRRDLERQADEARRHAEEAQRNAEEARRNAEARQAEDAARRLLEESLRDTEADTLLSTLRPDVAARPLDAEVLFAGAALPTLMDYVRFIKAMGRGTDPLRLLDSVGLEPATWAACSNAWGQAMVKRQELGLRFAELMGANWDEAP